MAVQTNMSLIFRQKSAEKWNGHRVNVSWQTVPHKSPSDRSVAC